MLPGNVLHQPRHAHFPPTEHADDTVKGIACATAEEYGLAVFNDRDKEESLFIFLQRCPSLLATDTTYRLRTFVRLFLHDLTGQFPCVGR